MRAHAAEEGRHKPSAELVAAFEVQVGVGQGIFLGSAATSAR